MIKWQDTVLVSGGGALAGASVYVYLKGTTTLATIYSDNGVTTQTNPLTTSATGFYSFYAADGRYDLSIQKTGYTTVTLTDISVDDAADASAVNATTLTATTGTIATLNSTNGTINTLSSTNGTVTTLNSTTGTIGTLNSTTATLTSATVPTLNSTTGTITTLNSTTATLTSAGIGIATLPQVSLRIGRSITGSPNSWGVLSSGAIQSDVTSSAEIYRSNPSTAAASFTLTDLSHFNASLSSIGAGSSITNQYGFFAASSLSGATNNYGFFGAISSGANKWNLYMSGTALNYVAGRFLFGTLTDDATNQVQVAGNIAAVTAGSGFRIKEGSNAKMGTATLVAGSVVVSNTSVTANSRILLTSNADGGTPGWLRVSARTASTSFTITSSSGTDTSTVAYLIMEPA